MILREVAEETLAIVERGAYTAPSGRTVDLREDVDRAVRRTKLYKPEDFAILEQDLDGASSAGSSPIKLQVTGETTAQAARRLVEAEGARSVAVLNFASAKQPGGAFLGEATAQEEALARASALHACLSAQPRFYEANRASHSLLYTDHIIYAPAVPFFRDEGHALLEQPFLASVLTAPAPNAAELLRADPQAAGQVHETLERRAGRILAVAAAEAERDLVLGAWGCGVFGNDPDAVAAVFQGWLEHARFRQAFGRVVFAIHDPSPGRRNLAAFQARFAS